MQLDALFAPSQVAIIGASASPGKIGHAVVANLIAAGYTGKILPVNPKGGVILNLPVVSSIGELPSPLDMAVLCVPPKLVLPALEELATLPVKAVVCITAGFKEAGRDGYALEQEVVRIAREHDIALLGPNCLGLMNTAVNLNATFSGTQPQPGEIAFYSQSGALCIAILDWAGGKDIGFSSFVSLGNKAIIDESHLFDYLAEDERTKIILGYMEGVEDGRRFLEAAKRVTRKKPVAVIKSGATASGAKAASSHTGAIAGTDQAYNAAFKQAGIMRAGDMASLFNMARCFSMQPLPEGPNLCVVTNSGGPGIIAADATEREGLMLSRLQNRTVEQLASFLPAYASLYNPIDIIGDADAGRYRRTLATIARDESVDAILVLASPTASLKVESVAQAVIDFSRNTTLPIFACLMGDVSVKAGRRLLQDASIPCYDFPEPAIQGIRAMYEYYARTQLPPPAQLCMLREKERAAKVIHGTQAAGEQEIVEFQAKEILEAYRLPTPPTTLARTSDEAVIAAEKMGFPVVLKIASPQISHKSDVGGVKVNLQDAAAVRAAFLDITSRVARLRKDAFISGCLVQKMAPKGAKEVIIGFTRDAQFGPLLMFGLGGVYVEVLKDVAFRLAPLTQADAAEMLREIKSFPLLRGVRGEDPVDLHAIEQVLLSMSQLAVDFPEIEEAECNPVLVTAEGALVADMRLTLSLAHASPSPSDSSGHLV